jgi:hypothetical protein
MGWSGWTGVALKRSTVACHTEKELVSTAGGLVQIRCSRQCEGQKEMNTMLRYQGPIYCHTSSSTDYSLGCLDTRRWTRCNISKCLQLLTLIHSVYIFVMMFFSNFSKPLPYRCPYLLFLYVLQLYTPWCLKQSTKHPPLYKIHYTIYLCLFCNNVIKSCHMNFPSPNRKGPSPLPKHPYWLWGPSSLPCNGEMGAILQGIEQLQHEVVVAVVVLLSAAMPLLPLHAFMVNMGATAAFTLNPNITSSTSICSSPFNSVSYCHILGSSHLSRHSRHLPTQCNWWT